MPDPLRGEVWTADLDPTLGHESAGRRPVLVVSADIFNQSPAGLVVVIPITSEEKSVRSHIPVSPTEGGLKTRSFIKCEDIRSVAKERLLKRCGSVSASTLSAVEIRVRTLLSL